MKGKKELLADILFGSKAVNLFKRLPRRNKLIVFNYHRIRPNESRFATAFDDGVYNLDCDEFSRQIKWLKNNTLILSENELLDCYKNGTFISPESRAPCVIITFDDGYRDNYSLAYPIMKQYGVPAFLFVATQMIQSRKLAWWDIIAYLIKHCTKPFITVGGRQFSLAIPRKEVIAFFLQRMKQEPHEQTQYLLTELSESCEVALPDALLQDKEILTWEELREMARHQIAIGSHSHSHRVMSTIGIGEQKEEMVLSKQIIEANIGRAVHSISYPVGELRYITAETFAIAESSGYLLGFTANTGVNDWKGMQPYGIKRMAGLLEKVSTVSLLTVLPELFTWDSATALK